MLEQVAADTIFTLDDTFDATSPSIMIYHPGLAVTDKDRVQVLVAASGLAHRKGQDLLVAARKMIKRSGFFSSDEKRLLNVLTEVRGLCEALKMAPEMYRYVKSFGEKGSLLRYLNYFSGAYPNWQDEYIAVNMLLEDLYEE